MGDRKSADDEAKAMGLKSDGCARRSTDDMNLDFSDEHQAMRMEFRKLLARASPRSALEQADREKAVFDRALWQRLADCGWLGTAVPEAHGGSGLDAVALCVLAEEVGRAMAAVPFTASACGFAHGLALALRRMRRGLRGVVAARGRRLARGVLLTPDGWREAPR